MGETLSLIIKDYKINPLFSFLFPYFTTEKISMLQTINEDNIIDKEMFLSYFLCEDREFSLLANSNDLVNYWELMIAIYILKEDIYKTKVGNIMTLFIFDETDIIISKDTFYFIYETFINTLKKIYTIPEIKKEDLIKLEEEYYNYTISIFKSKDMNEVKISTMKQFLEEDESLYNLMFKIAENVEETFSTNK